MGGTDTETLRQIFGFTPMPVTLEQLEKNNPQCGDIVYPTIETFAGTPLNGVIRDGGKFWISDAVMAEGIAEAEKRIAFWQKRIEYLQAQKKALAERFAAQPVVPVAT